MGLKGRFGLLEPSVCVVLEIEHRVVFMVGMYSTHMVREENQLLNVFL